jgi:tight adherence protein C
VERFWLLMLFMSVGMLAMTMLGPSQQERVILRRAGAVRPSKQDPLALEDEELALPFSQRVLGPAVSALRAKVLRYTPVGMRKRAEERLLRAGRPMEVGALFSVRFLSFGVLSVVGLVLGALSPGLAMQRRVLLAACISVLGLLLPNIWLNGVIGRRRQAVLTALPDVLDLLSVSVEAGLGFDSAIQKVAEKFKGPVGEEFQEYIKEVRLGRPRVDALRGLGRRTDLEDMRSFTAALVQAEQLGVSLAQVLRVQSDQMRHRRRQRAQERAMKVPIKMLFPLVIFILPTIFIVLFAPVAVHLMGVMGGRL